MNNKEIVEKFTSFFKLKDDPIAFFYTDNPPQEVYKPKAKSIDYLPCIIQLLNGVRRGKTLVLSKQSRNLCPGGLAYLGFQRIFTGLEYFLSTGIRDKEGNLVREGERFKKTPEIAGNFYDRIPFKKHPAKYAVFMPLKEVNPEVYKPLLVIFFINMDQLAGLLQLAHYDLTDNRTIVGFGSGCSSIITEPLAELERDKTPRAVVGMLTDILARGHIKRDEATFTIGYNRLLELYNNIEGSFLELKAWKKIQNRN
ncbi:MAG: DUF169 domain-containing protein [Promethearchaeota archaeon]